MNFKFEFNRCRVPRLRIDLEGLKMKTDIEKKQVVEMKDTTRMEETPEGWIEGEGVGEEFDLEFEFVEAEMSSRRVESKRKV